MPCSRKPFQYYGNPSGLIASVGSCLDEASSSWHDDGYINLIYRPFQTTLESDTDCILLCLCCALASGTWLTDRESIISVRRRSADVEVGITEPPGVKCSLAPWILTSLCWQTYTRRSMHENDLGTVFLIGRRRSKEFSQ